MISDHTWRRSGLNLELVWRGNNAGKVVPVENGRWRVDANRGTFFPNSQLCDSLAEAQSSLTAPIEADLVDCLSPAAQAVLRRAGLLT